MSARLLYGDPLAFIGLFTRQSPLRNQPVEPPHERSTPVRAEHGPGLLGFAGQLRWAVTLDVHPTPSAHPAPH